MYPVNPPTLRSRPLPVLTADRPMGGAARSANWPARQTRPAAAARNQRGRSARARARRASSAGAGRTRARRPPLGYVARTLFGPRGVCIEKRVPARRSGRRGCWPTEGRGRRHATCPAGGRRAFVSPSPRGQFLASFLVSPALTQRLVQDDGTGQPAEAEMTVDEVLHLVLWQSSALLTSRLPRRVHPFLDTSSPRFPWPLFRIHYRDGTSSHPRPWMTRSLLMPRYVGTYVLCSFLLVAHLIPCRVAHRATFMTLPK